MLVYNPITGQFERIADDRPMPIISRDARLVVANNTTPFVPSLGTSFSTSNTDLFGGTNSAIANFGIYSAQAEPQVIVLDAWRIRRFVVMCSRTASGGTSVEIAVQFYGRLIRNDGTATAWRSIGSATDSSASGESTARLVVATSLSGIFGYDQYRIVFRRNPDSTPAPELSNIRIYAES